MSEQILEDAVKMKAGIDSEKDISDFQLLILKIYKSPNKSDLKKNLKKL